MNDNPMHPAQRLQDAPRCTAMAKSTRARCQRLRQSTVDLCAACTGAGRCTVWMGEWTLEWRKSNPRISYDAPLGDSDYPIRGKRSR